MLKLTLKDNCTNCGECNVAIDGISRKLADGDIMVNPLNRHVDWEAIADAMKICEVGALRLEAV